MPCGGGGRILAGMPSLLRFAAFVVMPLLAWNELRAQQPAEGAPMGAVMGTVLCGDTQRPARFASVMLVPVQEDKPEAKAAADKANSPAAVKAAMAQMGNVTMLQGQTSLDGSYAIANVPPGDYYLSSTAPGYVSAVAAAVAKAPAGSTGKALYVGVPVVHVEANQTVRGDISLERGAAVMGTVAFDDGGLAGTLLVRVDRAEGSNDEASAAVSGGLAMMFSGAGARFAIADDRGNFRISGLPAGEYLVKASVQLGNSFSIRAGVMDSLSFLQLPPMQIYSPGTVHKGEATKIKLAAGEERGDVNIVVKLTGMHSVSGRVGSVTDHHPLNQATVTLVDANDKDFKRASQVDSTGAFTVNFVPPGTYALEVTGAADAERRQKAAKVAVGFATMHVLKRYEKGSVPVMVDASDVTGVSVELKEAKDPVKDHDDEDE